MILYLPCLFTCTLHDLSEIICMLHALCAMCNHIYAFWPKWIHLNYSHFISCVYSNVCFMTYVNSYFMHYMYSYILHDSSEFTCILHSLCCTCIHMYASWHVNFIICMIHVLSLMCIHIYASWLRWIHVLCIFTCMFYAL